MDSIPIVTLLKQAEKDGSYSIVYPNLISLVASQYPQLLSLTNFLFEEDKLHEQVVVSCSYL